MCFADKVELDSPQRDFYGYVNSKWLNDGTPLPADSPRWGSFNKLADESIKNQIELLNELCEKSNLSDNEKKLTLIWKASMDRFTDWENDEAGDISPIRSELEAMDSDFDDLDDDATYVKALGSFFAKAQREGVEYPLQMHVSANLNDSDNMVLWLLPDGMSLPSRGHYLDSSFQQQRKWFKDHLNSVAEIVGEDILGGDFTKRVLRFETRLAQISLSPEQFRQYDSFCSEVSLDDIATKVNEIKRLDEKKSNYAENVADDDADEQVSLLVKSEAWSLDDNAKTLFASLLEKCFDESGVRKSLAANCKANYSGKSDMKDRMYRVLAFDGDFISRVFSLLLLPGESRADVKAYLQYKLIASASDLLTKELDEAFFDFYGRQIGGQQLQKSGEKRSVELVNKWAGMLLGKIYVKRHFREEDKANILDMIDDILTVMKDGIAVNDWMTKPTKKAAIKKLSTFRAKIGYPDKWRDFSDLVVSEDMTLYDMSRSANDFNHKDLLDRVNTPKDLSRWEMAPQVVNAYFQPTSNEIVFPAAILQPPFYYKSIDEIDTDLGDVPRDTPGLLDALNFGGISAVVGHECSHGVDDQGSKYDHEGNLNNWWADEDREMFDAKCKLMARQAENFTIEEVDDEGNTVVHKQSAELTMGENLSDVGGLSIACKAMLKRLHPEVAAAAAQIAEAKPKRSMFGLFGRGKKKAAAAKAQAEERLLQLKEEESKLRRLHLEAFFRSWATIWRSKQSKAFEVKMLAIDPHAHTRFRGNAVKNLDEFYEIFEISEEDPMYLRKSQRVQMW